jgi:hypothetical protein
MKNYYAWKWIFLSIFVFKSFDSFAYSSHVLKSTLEASENIRDLYLSQNFKVRGGLKSWFLSSSTESMWELKHKKTQELVQILKTNFKLSDLKKGPQVLLKEYGILGLDILKSNWLEIKKGDFKVLKLDLQKMSTHQRLIQYLFELPNSSELLVLTCPDTLDVSCQFLIHSLKRD